MPSQAAFPALDFIWGYVGITSLQTSAESAGLTWTSRTCVRESSHPLAHSILLLQSKPVHYSSSDKGSCSHMEWQANFPASGKLPQRCRRDRQNKDMFAPFHAPCCEGRSLLPSLGTGKKQERMDVAENSPGWDKPGKGKAKHRRAAGFGPMEQNPLPQRWDPPRSMSSSNTLPSLCIFPSLSDLVFIYRVHFTAVGEKQQLIRSL